MRSGGVHQKLPRLRQREPCQVDVQAPLSTLIITQGGDEAQRLGQLRWCGGSHARLVRGPELPRGDFSEGLGIAEHALAQIGLAADAHFASKICAPTL